MTSFFKQTCIAALFAALAVQANAQDKKPIMQKAPANISIDGKMTEWGDSLALYDSKTKLNYTIANDDTNLYVIAFVQDRQVKRKIMAGGITISVNSDGKKHKACSVTYPIPDKASFMSRANQEAGDEDLQRRPSLIESTSIRVAGFKDVESDVITTNNTYGFKAAVNFDDKHNLVYETAIPLKMLNLKPGKKKDNQLAINISVNGIERPAGGEGHRGGGMEGGGIGGGGGMGGMGGGGGGRHGGGMGGRRGGNSGGGGQQHGDQSGMSQATDFWVEMALAPH